MYLDGQYWYTLMLYQMGYSVPMLYVPEGFIYVDFIKLEKGSVEEINQIINEVNNGDRSFDELLASDENKDTFRDMLKGMVQRFSQRPSRRRTAGNGTSGICRSTRTAS